MDLAACMSTFIYFLCSPYMYMYKRCFFKVGENPGYPFHSIPSSNLPVGKWILAEASPDQEYLQHPFKVNWLKIEIWLPNTYICIYSLWKKQKVNSSMHLFIWAEYITQMDEERDMLSCNFRICEVCESLKTSATQLTFAGPKYKLI